MLNRKTLLLTAMALGLVSTVSVAAGGGPDFNLVGAAIAPLSSASGGVSAGPYASGGSSCLPCDLPGGLVNYNNFNLNGGSVNGDAGNNAAPTITTTFDDQTIGYQTSEFNWYNNQSGNNSIMMNALNNTTSSQISSQVGSAHIGDVKAGTEDIAKHYDTQQLAVDVDVDVALLDLNIAADVQVSDNSGSNLSNALNSSVTVSPATYNTGTMNAYSTTGGFGDSSAGQNQLMAVSGTNIGNNANNTIRLGDVTLTIPVSLAP